MTLAATPSVLQLKATTAPTAACRCPSSASPFHFGDFDNLDNVFLRDHTSSALGQDDVVPTEVHLSSGPRQRVQVGNHIASLPLLSPAC
eukprot:15457098-Alexandrium_andersonii.AAC.1